MGIDNASEWDTSPAGQVVGELEREIHFPGTLFEVVNAACDRFIETSDASGWPAGLRIKPVAGARGVFELTWSFAGPDGRATWEWIQVRSGGVERPAVRWRRLGDHRILREP